MNTRLPRILTVFKPIGDEWKAVCYPDETETEVSSPVLGTIEETLEALKAIMPNYRFNLCCIRCGNSESKEFDVNEATGVCDLCNMTEKQWNHIAEMERRADAMAYEPRDRMDDPEPDRPLPEY